MINEYDFTLEGADLFQFEEDLNEHQGCWLYFDKLPPPEEEDPKKAGAKGAPKGKVSVEEIKPVHGKVWLDLTDLQSPGNKYTFYQR